ncbi:phosphatidylinositol N-acetylglucosaminyltransferase [Synchytrium endobioticum]|uniref:Phosphatidylinositol N-acetylglucosaminyltransferase n=1 Tax=Synchytrium endobioticum TaxID=286115 RepID=A0A507DC53_9FUNG|nr:phosphatidylinositol N-acetylglucosaminyltransferase [Synchytrium endobioticum]
MLSARPAPAPWRRKLYLRQDYPDNYVDPAFLQFLKQKRSDATPLAYWMLVIQTGAITQQIATTVMLVYCFAQLYTQRLSPVFLVSLGLLVAGFTSLIICLSHPTQLHVLPERTVLLLALLLLLSPVLKTLTQDTSEDTLYALTTLLFVCNCLFHDFSTEQHATYRFPDSVSINAAIFASVLLASRLSSSLHVFALMLTSIKLFALLPAFRRVVRRQSGMLNVALTSMMIMVSVLMLTSLSIPIALMYLMTLAFVTFLGPGILIRIHRYKNQFHGPWDEAKMTRKTQ